MSFAPQIPQPPAFGGNLLRWRIQTIPNLAKGGEIIVASVESGDRIKTRNGPEAPTLMVRCAERMLGLIVITSAMGNLEREGGQSGVRFRLQNDLQPPRTMLASESTNHSAFLLPNATAEVARIGKTKSLRVSFDRFQGDRVEFSFDVSGFDEARTALRQLCPVTP